MNSIFTKTILTTLCITIANAQFPSGGPVPGRPVGGFQGLPSNGLFPSSSISGPISNGVYPGSPISRPLPGASYAGGPLPSSYGQYGSRPPISPIAGNSLPSSTISGAGNSLSPGGAESSENPNTRIFGLLGGGNRGGGLFSNLLSLFTGGNRYGAGAGAGGIPYPVPVPSYPGFGGGYPGAYPGFGGGFIG